MFYRTVCQCRFPPCLLVRSTLVVIAPRPIHITPKIIRPTSAFPRRLYSEQTSPASPEAAVVQYEDVRDATMNNNILIVDVREPDEVKEHGKIPNSINIPVGNISTVLNMSEKNFLETYKKPKPSADQEIIFYCMIGKRSAMAQQSALSLGFKNAKNYLGSFTDWANRQK